MNLIIERASALSALGRSTAIVEGRQTIDILGNVHLSAAKGLLTLRTTDLNMEAVETIPATIEADGVATIPADKLHDIVRNADPGSQLMLSEAESGRMHVKSGRSVFKVPILPPNGFPEFASGSFDEGFTIPAKTLADMVSRVDHAVAQASLLTAAICVYLTTRGDQLHAVAASTAGIALRREPRPEGPDVSALLPSKFTAQLIRRLAGAEGDVRVSCHYPNTGRPAALIRLEHEGSVLTSRCFDAPAFYDYIGGGLLIEEHASDGVLARTDQDALSAALKRVLVMRDDKASAVRLTFADGGLTVSSRNQSAGEGEDEIACDYEGEPHDFLLDAGRLQETLNVLRGDVVEFGFCLKPNPQAVDTMKVIVRAPSDTGFTSILMRRVA